MSDARITKEQLVRDLIALGVMKGDLLNVKASLRSIGPLEKGVETLIEALLEAVGPEGTIVTDSFVSTYPPYKWKFWKNVVRPTTPSYAGALANALVKHPFAYRSQHPVQKFALAGGAAKELASFHGPKSYAYDVLRVMAERNGKNLKIGTHEKVPGVGTTHVAIGLAKIRQKRLFSGVRYFDENGRIKTFWLNWSGACMGALEKLVPSYYKTPGCVLGEGKIGNAPALLTSMEKTLAMELERLKADPAGFLRCGNPQCVSCALSWENHQDPFTPTIYRYLIHGQFKFFLKAVQIKIFMKYPF